MTAGSKRRSITRSQVVVGFLALFLLSFVLYPLVGLSFFPRTDAGQFVINVKAPTGTRLELTESYVKKVEDIVREVVPGDELNSIVSNIGVMSDLSALSTPNSAMHTAFVASWPQRGSSRQQFCVYGASSKESGGRTS